jgi:hypothetical protein
MEYKTIRQFKIDDIIEQAESARKKGPQELRLRRTPPPIQNEDADPWGYAKPAYSKVTLRACRNRRTRSSR